jgi:hypothetical protein
VLATPDESVAGREKVTSHDYRRTGIYRRPLRRKGVSVDEFVCYFLAAATKRPITYARRHLEDVRSTNVRHAAHICLKLGLGAGGSIETMDITMTYDGGAFAAGKPLKTIVPGHLLKVPYRVANGRITSTAVYMNTVPAGHIRAPADVQLVFALESYIDMIAVELGIDPIAFAWSMRSARGIRFSRCTMLESPRTRSAHGTLGSVASTWKLSESTTETRYRRKGTRTISQRTSSTSTSTGKPGRSF